MRRPVIVVENDPFPRLLQAFLEEHDAPERTAAIADFVAHDIADYPAWLAQLRACAGLLYPAEVRLASDGNELLEQLPGAHAVVTESLAIGQRELRAAHQLLVVHKYGTVLRNIDVPACADRDIRVLTVRRRTNMAVAEHAFALMLGLARKLPQINGRVSVEQLRGAGYPARPFDARYMPGANWGRIGGLRSLHGTTVGIIGLGEIGREIALRAQAFGMRTRYWQRTRWSAAEEAIYSAEFCNLRELLAESDWVCPLLPSNADTRGFLDAARLAQIKRGACIINVARAALVDRHALVEALASGHLGGLGLDSFYEEPGDAADPLLSFDNAIITPRVAAQPRFNAFGDLQQVIGQLADALS